MATDFEIKAVVHGIVSGMSDLRCIPHHLLGYTANIDARTAQSGGLDQRHFGPVFGRPLGAGESATAPADDDQIEVSGVHGRIVHGDPISCRGMLYPSVMTTTTIATWNVNSLRVRLPQLAEWLAATKPDIVALQETKLPDADFPVREISDLGYEVVYSGQKTYNGVAILSRKPVKKIAADIPGFDDEQRRVLAAETDGLLILDLYVPNGQEPGSEKYAYKLRWLEALEAWLRGSLLKNRDVVVLGDFNIAPEDRDVHDPAAWLGSVHVSEPERAAYRRLLDTGLVDVFRQFDQSDKSFSWWDYRAAAFRRNHGLRIDLILATTDLAKRCIASRIDREPRRAERPSDHTPVIAEFHRE